MTSPTRPGAPTLGQLAEQKAQRIERAALTQRWQVLARTGVDLQTVATWDRALDRRTRLLVPVDVQAFVVPTAGGEPTVAVTGTPPEGASVGAVPDPPPFAPGAVRPAGVHLHWAMPDALLRGRPAASTPAGAPQTLEFPLLPDRWTVVRAVFPIGSASARLRGWVIDARTQAVAPLDTFAGTFPAPPAGARALDRLDGMAGGSLLWTASYGASAGRFAFHDPLADLAADLRTLDGAHAVYVVGGWWSALADDPLAAAVGTRALVRRLRQLGWTTDEEVEDDVWDFHLDPRVLKLQTGVGLASPAQQAKVSVVSGEGKTVAPSLGATTVETALQTEEMAEVVLGQTQPRYASLLHGAVLGVPIGGTLPGGADDRPPASALSLALGEDPDDLVGAFGAQALGVGPTHRQAAERLAAAFTSDLMERLATPDGLAELEEREHGDGFRSLPGTPIPGVRPDRLRAEDSAPIGATSIGRKGRGALSADVGERLGATLGWKKTVDMKDGRSRKLGKGAASSSSGALRDAQEAIRAARAARPQVREVVKPPPRWFRPGPPMLAIRGARPSLRHHGDGLYDEDGLLRVRYPREVVTEWKGVVGGQTVVPSIGSGAVPPELLLAVREAVLLDPYATGWLAAAGAAGTSAKGRRDQLGTRLVAEMIRLHGADGTYDGSSHVVQTAKGRRAPADAWTAYSKQLKIDDRAVSAELAKHALLLGLPPSPVALTTWRQPWVPLWLEWRVVLTGRDDLEGWTLDGVDFERAGPEPAPTRTLTLTGRSPVGFGLATALHESIRRWLQVEAQRDLAGAGQVSDAVARDLDRLGDLLAPLDLVSASLDGVREQLLGIPWVASEPRGAPGPDGRTRARATGAPIPLFGGTLRIDALRLVDAFGRTQDVSTAGARTTTRLEVPGLPAGTAAMRLRPRLQHSARWRFRLVDPAWPPTSDPALAPDAFVDQITPQAAVNPVAGFLLPDHIDEALELFDVDGAPIGQLAHDPISGAVSWEPAPGRPLPPDAGPMAGLDAHALPVADLAVGVVAADAAARQAGGGVPAGAAVPPADASALSALLRAIDTTLWSVDTYAAVGAPTIAGLVGRPIAVVRATLTLEAPDDLADVDATGAPGGESARRAAFAALGDRRVPVRLGELTRSDDALLGFFVNDDYRRLHLVDRVVAATARAGGRHKGQFGLLGQGAVPPVDPIDHPYVLGEDTLLVRPGEVVRLTLLMLPAGRVHLTSGLLPRKALALAHDWVAPGLATMMPSVRVGPLLVDPSEIRLPLVASLGERQHFTRRTGPLTWRDDPIVAATQAALLPRMPHEAQEGWIRVLPETPPMGGAGAAGGTA